MTKFRFISTLAGAILATVPVVVSAQQVNRPAGSAVREDDGRSASGSPQNKKESAGEAVGTAAPPADSPTAVDMNAYRIGIDDELQISVWKEPDLSSVVTVRADGMITVPLLNDLKVVGLSTKELQLLLEEKFKGFVNEPQVTIIPRALKSRKVYLIGAVGHQGQFPLTGNMTVLQLLSEAGGLGTFAKSRSIHILRTVNGRQVRIPFNYKRAIQGASGKSEDIVLLPGDMVVVP